MSYNGRYVAVTNAVDLVSDMLFTYIKSGGLAGVEAFDAK